MPRARGRFSSAISTVGYFTDEHEYAVEISALEFEIRHLCQLFKRVVRCALSL